MKWSLFFAALALLAVLTCGVVYYVNTSQGLHQKQTSAVASMDAWIFDGVTFVTMIENRSDGLIDWERGFVCAQRVRTWEWAFGYETAEYKARFEIQSAWLIGNIVFYTTREGLYAYPVKCNDYIPTLLKGEQVAFSVKK